MPPQTTLELTIVHEASLGAAGEAVRASAIARGLKPERATRLESMVEELVREALLREAVAGEEDVTVSVGCDERSFVVTVRDHRLPLTPDEARHLPSRRLARLGFVDRLNVGFEGTSGNVIHCEALLIADSDGEDDLHLRDEDADAVEAAALVDAADIRVMVPEDAPGLIRCIYRCYGYSYPDVSLYDAAYIRRALAAGLMQSIVAVLPDGEIVGHVGYAYEEATDTAPESGRLVVDPRLRGHHLTERLSSVRNEIADLLDVRGMWAKAVTNHPVSQRLGIAVGSVEVGLLLGAQPTEVTQIGQPNPDAGWRSLMLMYRAVGEIGHRTISVPAHLAEVHGLLADRVGISRTITSEIVAPERARSTMRSHVNPAHGSVHLRVGAIGRDLEVRLEHELRSLARLRPGVIHLDLPLGDPAVVEAVLVAERHGFAWAGWIPELTADGDVVRLQRIGDHPIDFDNIACARPEGEALRDLVIDEWHRVHRRRLRGEAG
jgi:hypothetical protein